MSSLKIKLWFLVLICEFFFASLAFLSLSLFAEVLGIDSGGEWGLVRILFLVFGVILGLIPITSCLPRIRRFVLDARMAQFSRYTLESALWIFVMLGLFELFLQTVVLRNPVLTYDQDWGVVPTKGSIHFYGIEGYGITHYLAKGEVATPYDSGDISVVVLGDSFTEAWQVMDNKIYVSLAEVQLRSNGKMVNLHNWGKSGYGIPDYIYFAPIIMQYYKPEIVVIQLSLEDFEENGNAFDSARQNHFVINDNGNLVMHHENQTIQFGIYQKLIPRITLVSYGWQRLHMIFNRVSENLDHDDQLLPSPQSNITTDPVIKYGEQFHLLQEAYSGVDVIVLLLPNSPKIDGNFPAFIDVEYQKLLESAERMENIHVIDPKSEFDRLVAEGAFPYGFANSTVPVNGHLNKIGHIILGEMLAGKILEILR